jgi:hypothetical protein
MVSFHILGMERLCSVFGSKNGTVLFFVWFESLNRTKFVWLEIHLSLITFLSFSEVTTIFVTRS